VSKDKNADREQAQNDEAKRHVKMANDIVDKVTALGVPRSAGALGAHLSDICFALEHCRELIDQFLDTDVNDKDAMESVLIGIKIRVLEHISYHIQRVRRPLERVIDYCDEEGSTTHEGE
jgi:hypothetical protein